MVDGKLPTGEREASAHGRSRPRLSLKKSGSAYSTLFIGFTIFSCFSIARPPVPSIMIEHPPVIPGTAKKTRFGDDNRMEIRPSRADFAV
jgi:hypothetical protein